MLNFSHITEIHNIDLKFDLILSVHSLEHLTDFKIINFFKKISKPNSFLFLEVPNCPIDEEFLKRPYDSPHLMFFSKESFIQISKKFNLDLINLNVLGRVYISEEGINAQISISENKIIVSIFGGAYLCLMAVLLILSMMQMQQQKQKRLWQH